MRFRCPDKPNTCGPDLADRYEADPNWIAQWKYDGWRLQVYMEPSGLRLLSRAGNDMLTLPNLSASLKADLRAIAESFKVLQRQCAPNTVLDCELVGPRGKHATKVYILDCLAYDGKWLAETMYKKRWDRCLEIAEMLSTQDRIELAQTFPTGFLKEFQRLKAEWEESGVDLALTEGLVLKKLSGLLTMGLSKSVKSRVMFKLKFRDIGDQRF